MLIPLGPHSSSPHLLFTGERSEATRVTVPKCPQQMTNVCCEATAFLEPLEARTPLSEVQENAVGSPHLELLVRVMFSSSPPAPPLPENTFSPKHPQHFSRAGHCPRALAWRDFGAGINDLQSHNRGKRDIKIIKWVT